MPKIGTRTVRTKNDINVEVLLYYIDQEFAVTPVKPEYLSPITESRMLVYVGSRGKGFRAVKGATEEEALKAFKVYINKWFEEATTKEPVILIEIKGSSGENYYYPQRNDRYNKSVKQTGCKVDFAYFYGYRIKTADKERYFKDGAYAELDKDHEIYFPERYVIIDATPDLLKRCEEIIAGLNSMTEMMQSLFKTPETAIKTLLNHNIKLLNHYEQRATKAI